MMMASHLYIPPQDDGKPRHQAVRYLCLLWQITLAHALELAVATYSAFAGLSLAVSSFTGTFSTPDSVLPPFLVLGMGLFLGIGGLMVLFGVLVRRQDIRRELNIEQIGWIIQSTGWASYIYVALRYAESQPLALAAALLMTGGGIIRAIALLLLEQRLERAVVDGGDTEPLGKEDPTR